MAVLKEKEIRTVISIKERVEKHLWIISEMPAMHTLSGCDTFPKMYGIGNATVLN